MKVELLDLQPMLVARSEETEALTKVIEKETIEVEQVRTVVEKDEAVANAAAMESKNIKVRDYVVSPSLAYHGVF